MEPRRCWQRQEDMEASGFVMASGSVRLKNVFWYKCSTSSFMQTVKNAVRARGGGHGSGRGVAERSSDSARV